MLPLKRREGVVVFEIGLCFKGLMLVFLILSFQILFTITFWLLLRQHLTEQKALQEKEALLSEVKIGSQENEEKGN